MPSPNRGRAFRWISSCFNSRSNHHLQKVTADKTAPPLQPYLSSDDCCPICLGELIIGGAGGGSTVKVLPRCAHVFHEKCIGEWLPFRSHNCPICREPAVTEDDLRRELIKNAVTRAIANGSIHEYANHFSSMYLGYFIMIS